MRRARRAWCRAPGHAAAREGPHSPNVAATRCRGASSKERVRNAVERGASPAAKVVGDGLTGARAATRTRGSRGVRGVTSACCVEEDPELTLQVCAGRRTRLPSGICGCAASGGGRGDGADAVRTREGPAGGEPARDDDGLSRLERPLTERGKNRPRSGARTRPRRAESRRSTSPPLRVRALPKAGASNDTLR